MEDLKIAEEVARQAVAEITRLREENARLCEENAGLRKKSLKIVRGTRKIASWKLPHNVRSARDAKIVAFLRYPSKPLVDFALTLANLSWQEALALDLCARKRMTQEKAAEQVGYSVDAVQKWYRAGIRSLQVAWSDCEWIRKVIS